MLKNKLTIYHIYHIWKSYISYIFIYTIKCRVSTELYLWFGVWVALATLSVNFLGSIYPLIEKRRPFLKQNWLAASTDFSLFTCFL